MTGWGPLSKYSCSMVLAASFLIPSQILPSKELLTACTIWCALLPVKARAREVLLCVPAWHTLHLGHTSAQQHQEQRMARKGPQLSKLSDKEGGGVKEKLIYLLQGVSRMLPYYDIVLILLCRQIKSVAKLLQGRVQSKWKTGTLHGDSPLTHICWHHKAHTENLNLREKHFVYTYNNLWLTGQAITQSFFFFLNITWHCGAL